MLLKIRPAITYSDLKSINIQKKQSNNLLRLEKYKHTENGRSENIKRIIKKVVRPKGD